MSTFHVGHCFHDPVFQENSVSTASFSTHSDNFPSLLCGERLCKTNQANRSFSLLVKLCDPNKIGDDSLALGEGLNKELLYKLELDDLLSKLLSVLAVIQSCFVSSTGDSSGKPGNFDSGVFEDDVGSGLEILGFFEFHVLRHEDVF